MATTRRDRNKNFFKWEPVENGNNRFTPNAPMNWLYEIYESWETLSSDEDGSPDIDIRPDQEGLASEEKILGMTPPNEELLKMAETFPPPPEWFKKDEERPF